MYYGSSNEFALKGVELDRRDFHPISKIQEIMMLRPEEHGWERFGMNNDDSTTLAPFTEGAFGEPSITVNIISNTVRRERSSRSMRMEFMYPNKPMGRSPTRNITR